MGQPLAADQKGVAEPLTWEEICARHPDRWVVIVDIASPDYTNFDFSNAKIIDTFESRKAASPTVKAMLTIHGTAGCFWTGELFPPGAPRYFR